MSKNSHTILVVDPDERSYRAFESVLGTRNRVLYVPNGKTAIDLPDSQHIDIVFISHVLNTTDGIMLLESFKKRFPSLPVVFIAEQPKVDEVIAAFRLGARDLIAKPIDEKELLAVTQKISGFISNNKPRRRWFLQARKAIQTNNLEKKGNGNLKKILQKFKQTEILSLTGFNDSPGTEIILHAEDNSNRSIFDAIVNSGESDNGTSQMMHIKKSNPYIQAFFLGSFRVLVNNQSIENWPGKKAKSVFAYLLLNHKKKVYRDILMDLFWQKSCPDSARNCLNVTIHGLRRILEDIDPINDFILFQDECYYFNPEIDMSLDVEEFRKTWRYAQSVEQDKGLSIAISEFERAGGLYKGDFLEDELYDNWSSLDRENLREIYLVILDRLSKFYVKNGQVTTAIRLCEEIVQKDNCREDIHRRLMRCHYSSGQRFKAIRQFRKCKEILKRELEVEPDHRTVKLYKQIKKGTLN